METSSALRETTYIGAGLLFRAASGALVPISLAAIAPKELHTSGTTGSLSFSAAAGAFMSALEFFGAFTGSFIFNTSGFGISAAVGSPSTAFIREASLVTGQQAFLFGL